MTMRTTRQFTCMNGHLGTETTSENDQPYSKPWESVDTSGMREQGTDRLGYAAYVCAICGKPMVPIKG